MRSKMIWSEQVPFSSYSPQHKQREVWQTPQWLDLFFFLSLPCKDPFKGFLGSLASPDTVRPVWSLQLHSDSLSHPASAVTGSDVYMNSCLYGNGTSFVESLFEDFGRLTSTCVAPKSFNHHDESVPTVCDPNCLSSHSPDCSLHMLSGSPVEQKEEEEAAKEAETHPNKSVSVSVASLSAPSVRPPAAPTLTSRSTLTSDSDGHAPASPDHAPSR